MDTSNGAVREEPIANSGDPFDVVTQTGIQNIDVNTVKKGVALLRIVYAVAVGVAALWVYKKLFK